jgi:hypothetical protein
MNIKFLLFPFAFSVLTFSGQKAFCQNWSTEKHAGYNLVYQSVDRVNLKEYTPMVEKGMQITQAFFNGKYKTGFDVLIHPNRHSMDSTWQKDWKMPDFKSECWMVASGVANKLDMISPKHWDKEACEHVYSESRKTQQLITHELIHVYHGQLNASPDFTNVEGIDWFVEGLATFASGQCDSKRMEEVKKALTANQLPTDLDHFWTGNLKYGLSGSMVMYIDEHFGRAKLKQLLPYNKKSEILLALQTTEIELVKNWRQYLEKLPSPQNEK